MALSGIQIYKMLPQTNCKECGFPTCLAFAMKLAAKQVELDLCPDVSEESRAKLSEASAPPVRPFVLKSNGHEIKSGNEVVLFRHEKTFYSRPGLFLRVYDSMSADEIKAKVEPADKYMVDYVGIELDLNGFVVQADGGDFAAAVAAVRETSHKPLILVGGPEDVKAGLGKLADGETALIAHATADNWEAMAALAKESSAALAIQADTVDEMVALSEKVQGAGVKDVTLSPTQRGFKGTLVANTVARRMAIKKNFRPLGFPILSFPGDVGDPVRENMLAAQAIGKYAGFIVLDTFSPEMAYSLLVLRENIYTDPQKPIQVQPGIYEINDPGPEDPMLVTTNFSITYFSVANEVESSGNAAWLLVTESEGMSVLTAWAAGKLDSERIAKDVKRFGAADKLTKKRIILPGHVAVLSGETEEDLPDWEIKVGPREAVDIPMYLKNAL
jgi:acetyl-CoA decarbonylase/synthase complex subunit gamma